MLHAHECLEEYVLVFIHRFYFTNVHFVFGSLPASPLLCVNGTATLGLFLMGVSSLNDSNCLVKVNQFDMISF